MKEPYTEGPASHGDPESCVGAREGVGEALTGERTGEVSSREINSGVPTVLSEREGNTAGTRHGERVRDPARSETLCMCGRSLSGNREILCPSRPRWWGVGRVGKTEVVSRR
jgi:RNA-directed DNA polymerase